MENTAQRIPPTTTKRPQPCHIYDRLFRRGNGRRKKIARNNYDFAGKTFFDMNN